MPIHRYKTPEMDKYQRPVCEICQCGFDSLLLHVVKRHHLTSKAYKSKYGYAPKKSIVSARERRKRRKIALANKDTLYQNLVIGGIKTRWQKNNTATPVELLKEINQERMTKYWFIKKYRDKWHTMGVHERMVARIILKRKGIDPSDWLDKVKVLRTPYFGL